MPGKLFKAKLNNTLVEMPGQGGNMIQFQVEDMEKLT